MLLSVIIPCYNMTANGVLNFCLDSVLNQTINDYEVICIDDCSTDNTLEVLKDYKVRFPDKIKIIEHSVNKKQGGARNSGLAVASGDFIAFVDADDFIASDMYEKMINKAIETGAECVGCRYFIKYNLDFTPGIISQKGVAGKDIDTGVLDTDGKKKLILNGGSVWSKIYRRDLIFNYPERFPEDVFFEDNCLMPLIYSRVKHFEFVNEPFYYYYQRPGATTKGLSIKKYEDRLNSARTIVNFAKKYGYYDLYKEEIEALFIRIFYINTIVGMAIHHPFSIFWLRKFKLMTKEILKEFPEFLNNRYWNVEFSKKRHIICRIAKVLPTITWFLLSVSFLKTHMVSRQKIR